jgi:hypothetical protein
MNINNIEINPDIMREVDVEYFNANDFTDNQLKALNYKLSRLEMELDLYNVLSINNRNDKTDWLNSLINADLKYFQRLLMYCQLKNYFFEIQSGEESKDYLRYKHFANLYKYELRFAINLKSPEYSSIKTGVLSRG